MYFKTISLNSFDSGGLRSKNNLDAKKISTNPNPMKPFNISQGFQVGNFLIISGQASMNNHGEMIGVGNFDLQAKQVFQNLNDILNAGGSSLEKVIKVTIYLTDMSCFPKIVELRAKYFTEPYPADTVVEVKALALPELMIEIEAIALINGVKL